MTLNWDELGHFSEQLEWLAFMPPRNIVTCSLLPWLHKETHLLTQQHKPGLFAFPFLATIHPFGLCTSPTSVCHPEIFKLEISFETHKKTRSAWMDFGILKRKSLGKGQVAGTRSDGI